jgi:hypothetical protein
MSDPVTRILSPTRIEYTVWAGSITGQFLRGLQQRKLIGYGCIACKKVYIPPRGSCPTCGEAVTEPVEVAQTGTVTAFSVIRIPFQGQVLEPPYACAHILLDGADVPLLHILGECDVDRVRVGLRAEAVWAEVIEPTLASVRYFRPNGEPDAVVTEPGAR